MGFEWTEPPEQVFERFGRNYAAQVRAATFVLAQRYAPEIENFMKAEAIWTDRSGNARAALWAEAFDFIDTVVIAFGHGVEYGVFLELSNGGRFSIIGPALDTFIPRVWNDVKRMLS